MKTILEKQLRDGRQMLVKLAPGTHDGNAAIVCRVEIEGMIAFDGLPRHVDRETPGYDRLSIESAVAIGKAPYEVFISDPSEGAKVMAEVERANALLAANVPGLDILRAAIEDQGGHDYAMADYLEDPTRRRSPSRPTSDPGTLRAEYPRADLYLRADGEYPQIQAMLVSGESTEDAWAAYKTAEDGRHARDLQATLNN